MADIQYDPACVDCRRDAGKDIAGTTWQCAGHVRAERDWLRAKLANVMCEWENDVEVLTKERNAALTLAEQRGAAYDMTWREVESLRERLDQFEAYGFPNVAVLLDRLEALRSQLGAVREAAERLRAARRWDIEETGTYESYRTMVAEPEGDFVEWESVAPLLAALDAKGGAS